MLILISDAFDRSLPDKLSVFGEVTDDTTRLPEADVILVRSKTKCTKEYIDQAKKCRLIIRGGVGMDNIDRAYCEAKGIIAVNTPRSSAIAVAEMAFAFMLSTASRICFYDRTMKDGEWAKKTKRSELCGKTLTLLGYGNIPRQLAVRAKAFGHRQAAGRRSDCENGEVPRDHKHGTWKDRGRAGGGRCAQQREDSMVLH